MNIGLVIDENRIEIDVREDETLLEAILRIGGERSDQPMIDASCGGKGRCGKCRVRLVRGGTASGNSGIPVREVLACQITGAQLTQIWIRERFDTVIPWNRPTKLQSERKRTIALPEDMLRDRSMEGYGVAFDVGTTTVAAMLWKMGERDVRTPLAAVSAVNPQISFGADVISRIEYAQGDPKRIGEMQKLVVDQMNRLSGELTASMGLDAGMISRIAAVGNPTMMHFLFGKDPSGLAKVPFRGQDLLLEWSAEQLGLKAAEGAILRTLPVMGGHLGADAAAVILAERLPLKEEPTLAIDIGTNGELILTDGRGTLWGCSTAAGPAFEGGNISCGMRGEPGAIERVEVQEARRGLSYKVIGNDDWITAGQGEKGKARGICGSGLIDLASALLKLGWMDQEGRLDDRHRELLLAPGVELTQKDIRQLQTAKGAIGAGIRILQTKLSEGTPEDVKELPLKRICLAGAFGSYIRTESAVNIGLLPKEIPVESCGNLAGVGASLVLLSDEEWKRGCRWAEALHHVELADQPQFTEAFLKNMYFR